MHRYLVRIVCLGLLTIHAIGVVAAQTSSPQAGENWTRAKARTGAAANTRVQAAIRPEIQLVAYEAGEALPAVDERAPAPEQAPAPAPERAPAPAFERAPAPAFERAPAPAFERAPAPAREQAPAPAPEQAPAPARERAPAPATPPIPSTPIVERFPGGAALLRIHFADNDLDPASAMAPNAFRVFQELTPSGAAISYLPVLFDGTPDVPPNGSVVELRFRNLNPGVYWIVFGPLRDKQGSTMPTPTTSVSTFTPGTEASGVKKSFIVPAGRELGEQVEYPRFLRPENQVSDFDPGDRVDTRVLQLYYFRDARMVAEYINRNIQDLNQAAYDDAQRFAQQAREQADYSIDERRYQETLAVESARNTREVQRQLDQAEESFNEANQRHTQLALQKAALENAVQQTGGGPASSLPTMLSSTQTSIDQLTPHITAAQQTAKTVPALEAALDRARADEAAAVGLENEQRTAAARKKAEDDLATAKQANPDELIAQQRGLQNKLAALRNLQVNYTINETATQQTTAEIASLKLQLASGENGLPAQLQEKQSEEIEDRNRVVRAEASELRAAQEQFRREVAAGIADLNSYAKGKKESIDPVTQVTISVVGTSRIQLRGPIKGINKIARMVHQLDSPVGQVKIGIHTVQVNGEHGDRMDFVYERINQEVAHSRFLVNSSSQLLRRAVSEVAAEVAVAADEGYLPDGCPPDLTMGVATLDAPIQTNAEQRARRYLYAFFGSDFIGELEEMDSELLNSENKMLSLNSMDTISLAGALFVMAHADHPVRQRIVMRFQELLAGELPQRETEYIQALTHVTAHGKSLQNRFRKAIKIDNKNAAEIYFNAARTYHFPNTISYFNDQIPGQGTLNPVQYATVKLAQTLKAQLVAEMELKNYVLERSLLEKKEGETEETYRAKWNTAKANAAIVATETDVATNNFAELIVPSLQRTVGSNRQLNDNQKAEAANLIAEVQAVLTTPRVTSALLRTAVEYAYADDRTFIENVWTRGAYRALGFDAISDGKSNVYTYMMDIMFDDTVNADTDLNTALRALQHQVRRLRKAMQDEAVAKQELAKSEEDVFSKRLTDQFIDEQEEKSVELMEALRSHSSNVDNYLKRLAIAVEDDVAAQFYEPAFQRIRRVSRTYDVTLSQIETTTVLTNNRTLAKVSPSATFEFDLPQRDILLTEALNGSKALANEYGNLLKDGTFLAGTAMLSGQPPTGILGDNAVIQSIPGGQPNQEFGSELQKLIPDPAIYKFETGTGFEIRPIIQPDGHSIVYGFDYMYSTNVREPVRADEKHLGRIKRHFVHTDVQTSSYELREISRYTVALKASRTDRGVPLLEDLPGVGAAFRPLPSEESSLQTNIILGSSTIYPTVFDLMGLRWSAYVDELSSPRIATDKLKQSDRREELRSHLLNNTRERVNSKLRLNTPLAPSVREIMPGFPVNTHIRD